MHFKKAAIMFYGIAENSCKAKFSLSRATLLVTFALRKIDYPLCSKGRHILYSTQKSITG